MNKKSDIIKSIKDNKIIAIIRGVDNSNQALEVVQSLYEGGIKLVEVAFNTNNAEKIIESIDKKFGDSMHIGAGTVLDSETAKTAIQAGSDFILSPIVNKEMIHCCNRYGKVSIPGAATPTEVINAMNEGADLIKFFPAEASGVKYMKSLQGPLDHVEFIAVGGVNLNNINEFLNSGAVAVGIGSSLINNEDVKNNNYATITEKAKNFIEII
ncbi:4-Hydroxy-2-oxoglutarate aldolase / 2-dehydro-3-deoxyphosphogluconate aldolase [Halanaerobium saccharolyticum subsp. saccharolyticum DSM 6643]|uniref:4-Hydroxy-2-oxoglutarate aldolase / 2-dehydro-3-deoxyphosphogluconate aldolase n=1 Tax=Halanaerobium saccharolyticum subsp. saccharolyticum DSM 6643 TaxID=1293054 RepID=M5DYP2_9FIRM|nr:bifunctional 4-hydroxy-2-oxoglutarate aldolase/2-dehydro-3-deoxy-phosphogluconate aldolase [Halanaerobium saccharolyticum]CCU78713.1 4-Hydroxy-2-oxoglutarate aldolase / 2-dehydro-3-deoxyphosphogluconate aldolase [Halanaerobium saccharolyticum subsp. saccharolyticum DSM 6643]